MKNIKSCIAALLLLICIIPLLVFSDTFGDNDPEQNELINIQDAVIDAIPDQEYTTEEIRPVPSVSLFGKTLVYGIDFEISWSDNILPTTQASLIISGIGAYAGTHEAVYFTIKEIDFTQLTIEQLSDTWFYDSPVCPQLTVRDGAGHLLLQGRDYSAVWTDNDKPGCASVTVTSVDGIRIGPSASFTLFKASSSLEGSGTESDPYLISCPADWQFAAYKVNSKDENYAKAYYRLTADIDLNEEGKPRFDPIGIYGTVTDENGSSEWRAPFSGHLDGDGHIITANIDAESSPVLPDGKYVKLKTAALIGYCSTASDEESSSSADSRGCVEIKNLGTAGSLSVQNTGISYAGFVVGLASDCRLVLENINNNASVTCSTDAVCGAIIGCSTADDELSYVTNNGNVNSQQAAGGIYGNLSSAAGDGHSKSLQRVINYGNIESSLSDAAGIAAQTGLQGSCTVQMSECANGGNIKSSLNAAGLISGSPADGSFGAWQLTACFNSGNISTENDSDTSVAAAGLLSYMPYGRVVIAACFNAGTITNTSSAVCSSSGGFVASDRGGTAVKGDRYITGYSSGSIYAELNYGPIIGYSAAGAADGLAQSGEFYITSYLDCLYVSDLRAYGCLIEGTGSIVDKTRQLSAAELSVSASSLGFNFENAGEEASAVMPLLYWQNEKDAGSIDLSEAQIENIESAVYNGKAAEPGFEASYGSVSLKAYSDFIPEYSDNIDAGNARLSLIGTGIFSGTAVKDFVIEAADLESCSGKCLSEKVWSSGASIPAEPGFYIEDSFANILVYGRDYTVSYSGNTSAGTASALLQGIGNYTGSMQFAFEVVITSSSLSGSGTKNDPYIISSKQDFEYLALAIAAGESTYLTAEYRLDADIDLTLPEDDPSAIMLCMTEELCFSGVFDGNYHSIKISGDSGLFSYASACTVKNLTLTGSLGNSTKAEALFASGESKPVAAAFISCLVCKDSDSSLIIDNCVNEVNIYGIDCDYSQGSDTAYSFEKAAGFIGDISGSENCSIAVYNSTNKGNIKACKYAAGFIAGGSIPDSVKINLVNCVNEGSISGVSLNKNTSIASCAGIISCFSTENARLVLDACRNKGSINAQRYAGGLAAAIFAGGESSNVIIKNCSNTAAVTTQGVSAGTEPGTLYAAGGLIAAIADSQNAAAGSISLSGCFNSAQVQSTDSEGFAIAGSLIGCIVNAASPVIENCYYDIDMEVASDCTGLAAYGSSSPAAGFYTQSNTPEGFTGVQTAAMKESSFAALLSPAWKPVTDSYPQPSVIKLTCIYKASGIEHIEYLSEGSTINIPESLEYEGLVFDAWYTTDSREYPWDFENVTASEDITLYGIYRKTVSASEFVFSEPEYPVYSGLEKEASVTTENDAIGSFSIKYYLDGQQTASAPTEPGTYTVKIDIDGNDIYAAMADLTDESWTFTILPDTLPPLFSGIENGKTYYFSFGFSVSDANSGIKEVRINDIPVTEYKIEGNKAATLVITAEDFAGNTEQYTIYTKEISEFVPSAEGLTKDTVNSGYTLLLQNMKDEIDSLVPEEAEQEEKDAIENCSNEINELLQYLADIKLSLDTAIDISTQYSADTATSLNYDQLKAVKAALDSVPDVNLTADELSTKESLLADTDTALSRLDNIKSSLENARALLETDLLQNYQRMVNARNSLAALPSLNMTAAEINSCSSYISQLNTKISRLESAQRERNEADSYIGKVSVLNKDTVSSGDIDIISDAIESIDSFLAAYGSLLTDAELDSYYSIIDSLTELQSSLQKVNDLKIAVTRLKNYKLKYSDKAAVEEMNNSYASLADWELRLLSDEYIEIINNLSENMTVLIRKSEFPTIKDGYTSVVDMDDEQAVATFESEAPNDQFDHVKLDGKKLSEDKYDRTEGSTIITLKHELLETLLNGSHTLEIVSEHGSAKAEFSVINSKNTVWIFIIFIALLIVSAAVVLIITFRRRKKIKEQEQQQS